MLLAWPDRSLSDDNRGFFFGEAISDDAGSGPNPATHRSPAKTNGSTVLTSGQILGFMRSFIPAGNREREQALLQQFLFLRPRVQETFEGLRTSSRFLACPGRGAELLILETE